MLSNLCKDMVFFAFFLRFIKALDHSMYVYGFSWNLVLGTDLSRCSLWTNPSTVCFIIFLSMTFSKRVLHYPIIASQILISCTTKLKTNSRDLFYVRCQTSVNNKIQCFWYVHRIINMLILSDCHTIQRMCYDKV